jgi:hypothetical protein
MVELFGFGFAFFGFGFPVAVGGKEISCMVVVVFNGGDILRLDLVLCSFFPFFFDKLSPTCIDWGIYWWLI